jgi:hypothetical protein
MTARSAGSYALRITKQYFFVSSEVGFVVRDSRVMKVDAFKTDIPTFLFLFILSMDAFLLRRIARP